jgi:predicted NBD/HSP70 family sugar kinase
MSPTELVEAVRAGKRPAQQEVASFANVIGPGPAGMACMFDPDVISLGSGLTPVVNVPSARTQKPLRRQASPLTRDMLVPRAAPGLAVGTVGGLFVCPAQIPVRL